MQFLPRNNYVLVLPDEAETMSGSLFLPSGAVKAPTRGTVLAVGPGFVLDSGERVPIELESDQRVEFRVHESAHIIETSAGRCLVLREDEILGVIIDELLAEVIDPTEEDPLPRVPGLLLV